MAQIQVPIPSAIQNSNFSPTTPISKKKNSLRRVSNFAIFFSLVTLAGGIGEVMLARNDDCQYRYYNVQTCYSRKHVAAGIWCSIISLVTGLVGLNAGKKATATNKTATNYGYPIVGAISMGLMAILEFVYLNKYPSSFRSVQIMLICLGAFNMILFIIASSFMCCMAGCCQVSDDEIYVRLTGVGTHPEENGATGFITNPPGAPMQATQLQPQSLPQHSTVVASSLDRQTPALTPNAPPLNEAPPPDYNSIEGENFTTAGNNTLPS